jgi:DNA-binding transcriptional regulator GbsR (MarR family)
MVKTYALKRLLEHGPLTFSEIVEITGWPYKSVSSVVCRMMDQDILCTICEIGKSRRMYTLAA